MDFTSSESIFRFARRTEMRHVVCVFIFVRSNACICLVVCQESTKQQYSKTFTALFERRLVLFCCWLQPTLGCITPNVQYRHIYILLRRQWLWFDEVKRFKAHTVFGERCHWGCKTLKLLRSFFLFKKFFTTLKN